MKRKPLYASMSFFPGLFTVYYKKTQTEENVCTTGYNKETLFSGLPKRLPVLRFDLSPYDAVSASIHSAVFCSDLHSPSAWRPNGLPLRAYLKHLKANKIKIEPLATLSPLNYEL